MVRSVNRTLHIEPQVHEAAVFPIDIAGCKRRASVMILVQELNGSDQSISLFVAHQHLAFAAFAGVRVNPPPFFKIDAMYVQ